MVKKPSTVSRFSFTISRLGDLPTPASGRVYHYDTKVAGLCLCVTKTGAKSFYFYRKIDGRPERIRLGGFPSVPLSDAREAAKEMTGEIAKGRDPAAERRARRDAPTLKELFDHWWKNHSKPHKKSWKNDERIFHKYFTTLSGKRLTAISKADVRTWHTRLGKKHGPYQANRARALLSAMWKGTEDLGCDATNPAIGVKRFQEESRERYLHPEEMKAFFAALAEEEPLWRDFFLLCLFTGARKSNVLAMRWEELDLERGTWHLPGQQMKNKMPLVIVLAEPARVVLESRAYLREATEWVFPASRRTNRGHVIDPYKPWARILKRAGIEGLRPHDLRRSLGSWQAEAGASLAIIGKTLGHRDHKSTETYARLQLDPVRESVEAVTRNMQRAAGLLTDESDDKTIDVNGKEGRNDE